MLMYLYLYIYTVIYFRSMSVQPTDFENAAFSVFVVLLSRAIVKLVSKIFMFLETEILRFELN